MSTPYLQYTPENPDEKGSVTIIIGGQPYTLTDDSPMYEDALGSVKSGVADDELLALFQPVAVVGERLTGLSERITTDGANIFFDGDAVDAGIARHILRIMSREGRGKPDAYMPVVRFLDKLYQNPSLRSRQQLYQFLRRFDFTITADGDFIAYKGVRRDFTSIHAGPGIVDLHPMRGHLPNRPGSVLQVSRSYVNNNPHHGCSTGLHVGTFSYARGFSQGGLVTCVVNPRDVVSVPIDAGWQKVRVSRYRVLEAIECEYVFPVYDEDDEEEEAA
ncbi:hypothetical protein [Microbacterium sp. 13-71-7]|uniref:hypothetical protein n=1 Tax=Microbacterium sp. 13-71-7 TaxID=1970399 RepID=UPI000BCB9398|nr:hypothetical protein [Microbacterium sp. 13-71-7]OZB80343.1 MAG: hypothetical protein B7X32_19625 [Microbacterium sp. 13-71-7]